MRKSEWVMQEILKDCISGSFSEGKFLPSETELCQQFKVSRSSIRSALKAIENKGVINILPKRGSLVAQHQQWNWLDQDILNIFTHTEISPQFLKNILIARLIFEPNICAIAAITSDTNDLIKIYDGYKLMEKGAQNNDRVMFIEGDQIFHSAIVNACKNPFLSSLNNLLITAMYQSFNKTLEINIDMQLPALEMHKKLLELIRERNGYQAKKLSHQLISNAISKVAIFDEHQTQLLFDVAN